MSRCCAALARWVHSTDNPACLRRTQAREELRLQTGTLRFDISTLAGQLDKSKRKEALKLGDAFYAKARLFLDACRVSAEPGEHAAAALNTNVTAAALLPAFYLRPQRRLERAERPSVCRDTQVDDLDYAMRKKDATKANAAYAQVKPRIF